VDRIILVQPKTTNRSNRVFFSMVYSKQWNSTR